MLLINWEGREELGTGLLSAGADVRTVLIKKTGQCLLGKEVLTGKGHGETLWGPESTSGLY